MGDKVFLLIIFESITKLIIMKLFTSSLFICFLLFSCSDSKVKPQEAAQQRCDCEKLLSTDLTAFSECNSKVLQTLEEYKSDVEWAEEYQEEYLNCLRADLRE